MNHSDNDQDKRPSFLPILTLMVLFAGKLLWTNTQAKSLEEGREQYPQENVAFAAAQEMAPEQTQIQTNQEDYAPEDESFGPEREISQENPDAPIEGNAEEVAPPEE